MTEPSHPNKNAINWFEIPASDFDRAVKFYNTIMNINMQVFPMGPAQMAFFPMESGSVGGAVVKQPGHEPGPHGPLVYLNVTGQFDQVLGRVENAGGKVVSPKRLVTEEIGYVASFIDTEGNQVAIHAPK
ncbi:MAG: VOC family protein [Candidatus Zixiibacteriota bacterium]